MIKILDLKLKIYLTKLLYIWGLFSMLSFEVITKLGGMNFIFKFIL